MNTKSARIFIGYSALLTLALPGCLAAGLGSVGGIAVIGKSEMDKVRMVASPKLTADASRLAGKSFNAGTPEYYAALCVRGYIDGRFAERALQQISGDSQRSALQGQMIGGYGGCAQHCRVASTQLRSSFSDLAAKYQPHCAQGASGVVSSITIDALAKRVDQFKSERQPLGLFLADKDCRTLLAQAQSKHPTAPRLPTLSAEIDALGHRHAAAIAKGRAFFEGPQARENFAAREALDAERRVIKTELDDLRERKAALHRSGTLNAHMKARRLDDMERSKRRLLAVKDAKLARLKDAYRRLAMEAGVID